MPRRKSPLNPGFSPEARRENLAKCKQIFYNGSSVRQIRPGGPGFRMRLSGGLAIPASSRRAAIPSTQFSFDLFHQKFGFADRIARGRYSARGAAAIPITQAASREYGGGHDNSLLLRLFLQVFHGD